MTKWTRFEPYEKGTWPIVPGIYKVVIVGDEEREGAHVYYSYDDYETFARLEEPNADGEQKFHGDNDEEVEQILAWFGPIDIPECDCL